MNEQKKRLPIILNRLKITYKYKHIGAYEIFFCRHGEITFSISVHKESVTMSKYLGAYSIDQQNRILHRDDKVGVLHELGKVLQSHEGLCGGICAPLIERHAEHIQGRDDHKDQKQDGSRCNAQEEKAATPLSFFHVLISFLNMKHV